MCQVSHQSPGPAPDTTYGEVNRRDMGAYQTPYLSGGTSEVVFDTTLVEGAKRTRARYKKPNMSGVTPVAHQS